jgi:hypothetical protein
MGAIPEVQIFDLVLGGAIVLGRKLTPVQISFG